MSLSAIDSDEAGTGTTILFLGTGAGDWPKTVPTEEEGLTANRDYRRFSAVLVNKNILIDFGPTLISACGTFEVDTGLLTDVLLTHSHWDHMNVAALRTLAAGRTQANALRLWGHPLALARLPWVEGVEHHPVQMGDSFCLGRYTIHPVAGNHWVDESQEQPLLYLFFTEQERWFYATDTAWFPTSTWRRLAKLALDAIIWDATYGDELISLAPLGQFGHNTLAMLRLILPTTFHEQVLKPNAQVILTHLSKNYHPAHAVLTEKLAAEGMVPAYDGMVVRIEVREQG